MLHCTLRGGCERSLPRTRFVCLAHQRSPSFRAGWNKGEIAGGATYDGKSFGGSISQCPDCAGRMLSGKVMRRIKGKDDLQGCGRDWGKLGGCWSTTGSYHPTALRGSCGRGPAYRNQVLCRETQPSCRNLGEGEGGGLLWWFSCLCLPLAHPRLK